MFTEFYHYIYTSKYWNSSLKKQEQEVIHSKHSNILSNTWSAYLYTLYHNLLKSVLFGQWHCPSCHWFLCHVWFLSHSPHDLLITWRIKIKLYPLIMWFDPSTSPVLLFNFPCNPKWSHIRVIAYIPYSKYTYFPMKKLLFP